jgi:LmbE family N-acetylglucosaminyl deacetylase
MRETRALHERRLLLVSPHLDDAVLSCGALMASAESACVLTVFAGTPPPDLALTDWDRACGFADGVQAMRQRRAEDRAALQQLGAAPQWLDFLDAQYGATPEPEEIALALRAAIDRLQPEAVLIPLGLYHSDHVLVHLASLQTRQLIDGGARGLAWIAYEDVPYRRRRGWLQTRIAQLHAQHVCATPLAALAPQAAADTRKSAALGCYASQVRALGADDMQDAARPESYWQIEDMAA